ncbi:MAG: magnesium transporter CorA family protein [Dehalococcoidales bacterium]|jgi:magnesium transporter
MISPQKNIEQKPLNLKTISWGDLTWDDFVQPTEDAKKYLAEHYDFNPMDIDDCFSRRQLSKVDVYDNYLFIVFHLPVYDKATRISTIQQWSAFVGEKYLVTLRPGTITALDDLHRECEFNEEARKEYFSQGSGYLLYQILDRAVDAYIPVLDKILELMEDIEDNVFNEETEAAKDISFLRRDIVTQRRVMFPTRVLLTELENRLRRFTKIDLTVYYGDLMDHMNSICDTLDECKEIIEVYKDADFILSEYRANRTIRTLVVIATVALPFLIVTGLYSMNVPLPGGIEKGSPQTFILLLVIILVIIGALLSFFRRKHLI